MIQTDPLIVRADGFKSTRDRLPKFSLLNNLIVENLLDFHLMLSLSDTMFLLEHELLFAHYVGTVEAVRLRHYSDNLNDHDVAIIQILYQFKFGIPLYQKKFEPTELDDEEKQLHYL